MKATSRLNAFAALALTALSIDEREGREAAAQFVNSFGTAASIQAAIIRGLDRPRELREWAMQVRSAWQEIVARARR